MSEKAILRQMSEERRPTCGSLFAGIGGGDLGLERAGWDVIWQVELDPWRRKVLERHWPTTLRWDDIQTMPYLDDPGWKVDLIIGGFPCQDLSVAGKRAGLKGERSGLFFDFMRVAAAIRPRWLIVENVPGLLSSHEGQDMGIVLETLSECGYGLGWRILDSQYFGVPQRRRRVYIVGHLGAPCPPEILFESEGGGGDTPAGGKAGQDLAAPLGGSTSSFGGHRNDLDNETYVAAPLEASDGHHGRSSPRADGADNLIAQPLRSNRWGGSDSHGDEGNVICGPITGAEAHNGNSNPIADNHVCEKVDTQRVRVTTKFSCGLDPCPRCPDGRRYAALGDAMTVNVIKWIGRRILAAIDV